MEEKRTDTKLDPIKYEMLYNRIKEDLDDARKVIKRLAFSVIVREAGETAESLHLPSGENVMMSSGAMIHILSASGTIEYALKNRYEEDDIGIYDGDQFINNDPNIGGIHRPDMILVAPIFYKGKLVCWVGNFSHVAEVGAIEPGGQCAAAKDCYHEGLLLPCVKIVEKGKIRRDLMGLFTKTVRDHRPIGIDTRAKIAGNERMRRNILKIIDEYGLDFFEAAMRQFLDDSEKGAKLKIKSLRPGMYQTRIFADTLTAKLHGLRVVQLAMEVTEDGRLIFTSPIVSPQSEGYNNVALPGIINYTFCGLLTQLFYDLRWNTGCLKRLTLDFPLNSMINAGPTAAVGLSPIGIAFHFLMALNDVLAQAAFVAGKHEDIIAPCPVINCIIYAGLDQFGRPFGELAIDTAATGGGARYDRDGVDSSIFQVNLQNETADCEAVETTVPILSLSKRNRPDSGGPGKYRGGVGIQLVSVPWNTDVFFASPIGSGGFVTLAQGLWGGYPAGTCGFVVAKNTDFLQRIKNQLPLPSLIDNVKENINGEYEELFPSLPIQPFKVGDIIAVDAWGGNGLGDPIERKPELVAQDLENSLITPRAAEEIYCVAIDPDSFEVDSKKSEHLRDKRRKQRLKKGMPAKEYVKEMVRKRKNKELPQPVLDLLEHNIIDPKSLNEQMDWEAKWAEREEKTELPQSSDLKGAETVLSLTPYVKVVKDQSGKLLSTCNNCEHIYCEAQDNFKLSCLIYDRDPKEIQPGRSGPDKDWMIYREFYCPGCGAQIEVEATPLGMPILHNAQTKFS